MLFPNTDIKILLLDDASEIHALVKYYFRKSPYQIFCTASTAEARNILNENKIHLLILDILLGQENGLDFLAELRKKYSPLELPVLIATGLGQSKDVADGLKAGANDYLRKPFAEVELLARVETQLAIAYTNRRLKESHERFRRIVENLSEVVYYVDYTQEEPRLHYISPVVERMTGFSPDAFLENPDKVSELTYGSWRHYLQILPKSLNKSLISRWLIKKERIIWVENQPTAVHDEEGKLIAIEGVIRDITNLQAWDSLTGLANKTLLLDTLEQAFRRGQQKGMGLLLLSLRKFKEINQSFGHSFSERLLIESARRIKERLNNFPVNLIVRFGEASFAILFPQNASREDIKEVSKILFRAFEEPFHFQKHTTYIAAAIGVAEIDEKMESAEEAVQAAELALSSSLTEVSNTLVFYNQKLAAIAHETLHLEAEIQEAVRRKSFRIFGQPILDLHSGKIGKVELLLRWPHPKRGMLSPALFIPYLEESGLILQVGEWLLKEACRFVEKNPSVVLTVNFSAIQLNDSDIVKRMERIFSVFSGLANRIEIELTESVIFGVNQAQNLINIEGMRNLGLRLALDDFGTGYSSLSYLKYFSADTLKVDRSFLSDLGTSQRNFSILKAILQLARDLGLDVVTEGVETEEQYRILEELGCKYLQGYLIAKPMPLEDLPDFIENFDAKTSFSFQAASAVPYTI